MQISTVGIVVRDKTVGDDRLIHLLTRDKGIVTAFARGAMKPRGKLTSSTELLCYSKLILFSHKDSYTVDSADCECSFFELRKSLEALSLASYIADLACELSPHEEEATEYLSLVLNTLYLLKGQKKPLPIIKSVFELRILAMAGFMPDLTGCCVCGEFSAEPMYFLTEQGILFCPNCKDKADKKQMRPLSTGVLAAMRHIVYSEAPKLFSFNLTAEAAAYLGEVSESYLVNQLGRRFKSLDFYRSIMNI